MGLDARVRYTKMVIKDAFISLLKEKPLNKITVKEICGLAEINRATFYKHYCDPFDLLEKMEQEILSNLRQGLKASPGSPREAFTFLLVNIRADGERYQTLFSENGDSKFPGRIFRCTMSISQEISARSSRGCPQNSRNGCTILPPRGAAAF